VCDNEIECERATVAAFVNGYIKPLALKILVLLEGVELIKSLCTRIYFPSIIVTYSHGVCLGDINDCDCGSKCNDSCGSASAMVACPDPANM